MEGDSRNVGKMKDTPTETYQSLQCIKGGEIPAKKYPIRTLTSEMLARATWFLQVETYSTSCFLHSSACVWWIARKWCSQ